MAKKRQIIFPSDKSTLKEKSTDVSLTHVDKKLEEEHYQANDKQNIFDEYESDDDLTRRLIQIIKRKEIPDLLGVFGVYYDNKVEKSVNLLKKQYSEILYFTIDIDYEEMDIYNCIASVLYNYLNEKGYFINKEKFLYYANEIIKSFENNEDTSFMDTSAIKMRSSVENNEDFIYALAKELRKSAENNEDTSFMDASAIKMRKSVEIFDRKMKLADRTKNMEILINSFFEHPQLLNTKIVIFINLNSTFLSNKMLRMLEKIKNENMIFILGSLQNMNIQINHLDTTSFHMGRDLFFRYFFSQNIFNVPQL